MEKPYYTIKEICEKSGFTRRTVRYYISEGLLDPPAGRGRGGFYFDSHLKRLRDIKAFQDQGLKLAVIGEMLKIGKTPPPPREREIWVRHHPAPGFEIHVARDLEQKKRRQVEAILRMARNLLGPKGDTHE